MVGPEPFVGVVEDVVDSRVGSPPAQSPKGTALTVLTQKLRIGKQGEQGFMPQSHDLDQDDAQDEAESDQKGINDEPGFPVVEGLLLLDLLHPSVMLRSTEEAQKSFDLVNIGIRGLGVSVVFHDYFSFIIRIGIAACSR
jgi:hypothetical protein